MRQSQSRMISTNAVGTSLQRVAGHIDSILPSGHGLSGNMGKQTTQVLTEYSICNVDGIAEKLLHVMFHCQRFAILRGNLKQFTGGNNEEEREPEVRMSKDTHTL